MPTQSKVPSVVAHDWLATSGIAIGMKSPGLSVATTSARFVCKKAGILSSFTHLSYEKFAKVPSIFSFDRRTGFGFTLS
jgi:hypothetical protein